MANDPTEREVEEWAQREKKRREAWLAGPSEDEKREWIERQRHLKELRELYGVSDHPDRALERQLERRLRRDAYLARAGILDMLVHSPSRLGAKLIRSGLDAQYEYYTEPTFRRRLPPDFSSDD